MSNRDRAVEVLRQFAQDPDGAEGWVFFADELEDIPNALIAAGLIHVGQRFCTKVANCRMADGHAVGCERT